MNNPMKRAAELIKRIEASFSQINGQDMTNVPHTIQFALAGLQESVTAIVLDTLMPERVIKLDHIAFMVAMPGEYSDTPEAIADASMEVTQLEILLNHLHKRVTALEVKSRGKES